MRTAANIAYYRTAGRSSWRSGYSFCWHLRVVSRTFGDQQWVASGFRQYRVATLGAGEGGRAVENPPMRPLRTVFIPKLQMFVQTRDPLRFVSETFPIRAGETLCPKCYAKNPADSPKCHKCGGIRAGGQARI